MDRRIFGIENEYGVTCTSGGTRRLSPDEVARYLFRRVVSLGRSSNVFLANGSRLYLDVGSHPEYATAECDDLRELVAQDKAGERILEGLAEDAMIRMRDEGIEGEVYVFKNNTDSAGNSYGCHENFLISRRTDLARVTDTLVPFLITRQLVCGAGKITGGGTTGRRAAYSLSQRAEHIWEGVSSATTRSRPIINTRDEPHADAEKYRRLHVIVGDSNMSETTTLLKVGTVDILLRMIEAGVIFRDQTLENPVRAIREISADTTGRQEVRLANHRRANALAIQRTYHEKAAQFLETEGMACAHDEQVMDLWGRALDAIEAGRPQHVGTEIDWVIKRQLLEGYAARHGLDLEGPDVDARLLQLDLAYHDVNRRRGLFYLLQRRGRAARVCTDLETFVAKERPPQTTRARLRGDFLRAGRAARRDVTVDWVHLKVNDGDQRTVLLKDPFAAEDRRVERLVDAMAEARGAQGPGMPLA